MFARVCSDDLFSGGGAAALSPRTARSTGGRGYDLVDGCVHRLVAGPWPAGTEARSCWSSFHDRAVGRRGSLFGSCPAWYRRRLFVVLQIAVAFTRYEAFVIATVLGGALVSVKLLLARSPDNRKANGGQLGENSSISLVDSGGRSYEPLIQSDCLLRFGPGATFRALWVSGEPRDSPPLLGRFL